MPDDAAAPCGADPASPRRCGRNRLGRRLRGIGGHIVLICAPSQFAVLAARLERPAVPVDLPARDSAQRAEPRRQTVPALDDADRQGIAERFDQGPAGVRRTLGLAVPAARIYGRPAPDAEDLPRACDRLRIADFHCAAQRLDCDLTRADIVLRPETKSELDLAIGWARHGPDLFGPQGVARNLHAGRGLACLFSGPPGAGKSMAARIVAAEVDFALYRIDISQVVDKFICESEKPRAALFDEAEHAGVALFLDEADCIFCRRTELRDSHDRYANITVDFLLQRLESFQGQAILATKMAGNMDDAFLRRLRVRAEFVPAAPTNASRSGPSCCPHPRSPPKISNCNSLATTSRSQEFLGHNFQIAGGEIRNAVYTAHLLAAAEGAPRAMRHCVRGLWRELGKVGRLSDRSQLGPWRGVLE